MTPLHDLDEGPLGVLIAGAGVAGLETLVAVRRLAPHEVAPTLIAPDDTFSLRALSVFEPFGYEPARRYPLAEVTGALDAGRRRDAVAAVDRARREVRLRSGTVVPYDVLVLAVGAVPYPAFDHGILFDYARNREAVDAMLRDSPLGPGGLGRGGRAAAQPLDAPGVRARVPPRSPVGQAAPGAGAVGRELAVTLVTAEPEPLAAFGAPAGDMIRDEFEASRIDLDL